VGPEGVPVTVGIEPVGCCAAIANCFGLNKPNKITPQITPKSMDIFPLTFMESTAD